VIVLIVTMIKIMTAEIHGETWNISKLKWRSAIIINKGNP